MTFINRESELKHLEREYNSEGAKFVVIYGRRRVGKTRLIEEFIRRKESIYYLAAQETDKQQISEFKNILAKKFQDDFLMTNEFSDWKALFEYLKKIWPKNKRLVIAIDEITYIIKSNPSFPSYLQKFWDEFLIKTKTFLILSGSLIGLIIKSVLSYDSPLYGRRTSQIFLLPFSFQQSLSFLTGFSFVDNIRFYSLIGGIPKYLILIKKDESFSEFLENSFFNIEGFFYQEGLFILSQEFKEPSTYMDILKAISIGNSKLNEIGNSVGIETKILSKYLDILMYLNLVKKIIPVTENPKRFRGAIYTINDPFLNFWHRFILPNRSDIEMRNVKKVSEAVLKGLNSYLGPRFEDICSEYTQKKDYTKIGKWWGHYRDKDNKRKEIEIDIVALNENTREIFFAECKWQEKVDAEKVLNELKEKAKFVQWNNEKRKEHYAIFAKSFSKKLANCFDLRDIEKMFIRKSSQ